MKHLIIQHKVNSYHWTIIECRSYEVNLKKFLIVYNVSRIINNNHVINNYKPIDTKDDGLIYNLDMWQFESYESLEQIIEKHFPSLL